MPYDPSFPPPNAELISAQWRAQFNALKALIDAQAALITTQSAQIAALQAQIADVPNQIAAALAGSSNNSNAVASLGLVITTNPVELFQVQPIADKLDELLNALRR